MDKEQFNQMPIKKQIQYMNKRISEYGNATSVCKALGYKDESTIRKRFKAKGYHLNKEKTAYVWNNNETLVNNKSEAIVKNNNSNNKSETFNNKDLQELLNVKDDILKIVQAYKSIALVHGAFQQKCKIKRMLKKHPFYFFAKKQI